MAEELARKHFAAGEVVFAQGDQGEKAYLIDRGVVEISTLQAGKKVVIARLGTGDLFGELALINQQTRSATATALEGTEVVSIDEKQLDRAIKQANPLVRKLLQVNLGRFHWTQQFMLQHAASRSGHQSLEHQARADLALEKEITRGMEAREFELHYQPIITLNGGWTVGFEALIRWRHPTRGMVYPDQFIGVAERTGLIVELGRWVLAEALEALKAFQLLVGNKGAGPRPPLTALAAESKDAEAAAESPAPLFMSVNVSARQLLELQEVDRIGDTVRASGVEPSQVTLEITESLLVDDPAHAAAILQLLRGYGMKIALDDFGTGYSSLSYLHRFPLDTLKIDQRFIATMGQDPKSYRIVRAIVGLAREMGMGTVAEGIELNNQLNALREIQCENGQGYLMSRPASFREARKLLRTRQARW